MTISPVFTVAADKAKLSVGNEPLTVKSAFAVPKVWEPAELEPLNVPVVIVWVPAVELVTSTLNVQVMFDPKRTPAIVMLPAPAVAVICALLQVEDALGEVLTVMPVGSVTEKPTSLRGSLLASVLAIVKVTVDVAPGAMVVGEKAAVKLGATGEACAKANELMHHKKRPNIVKARERESEGMKRRASRKYENEII